LKFLPAEMASNHQALERFQFEARAASALNHENICTVYEIDEFDGQPFLALELLKGQPLSERLARPLSLDTLLDIGSAGCRWVGCGASPGVRAPGYQAGQHLYYRAGTRQGARLRAGKAGAGATGGQRRGGSYSR